MSCETVKVKDKNSGYVVYNKGEEPEGSEIITDKQAEALDKKRSKAAEAE